MRKIPWIMFLSTYHSFFSCSYNRMCLFSNNRSVDSGFVVQISLL